VIKPQIEQALRADDPRFADAVAADPWVHYKRRVIAAALGLVIGIGLLVIVRECPRSANSRKSVIAGDLWYSRRVAVTTGGGTVWSLPPAISSSGLRVLLRVSTLGGGAGREVRHRVLEQRLAW
jgi:Protein of unknown function (DUF3040)